MKTLIDKIRKVGKDFKRGVLVATTLASLALIGCPWLPDPFNSTPVVGVRSTLYGYQQQQPPNWWVGVVDFIKNKFPSYDAGVVWGIGEEWSDPPENGTCYLNFPNSGSYPNIRFGNTDENESYLDAYDTAGYKVWVQVEPGKADAIQLIDLVLAQYSHHSSIIGFGIDVEWLGDPITYPEGRRVTNSEITTWVNRVKSYNPDYKIFLKHWDTAKMPNSRPNDVVFMNDGQGVLNMNELISNMKAWGKSFPNNEVGFQVGYQKDKSWWGNLTDPIADIGTHLYSQIPNMKYYYWVDFSILDVYKDR